jgi:hypothetical protein
VKKNGGKKCDVGTSEVRRQDISFKAVKGNDIRNLQVMTEERGADD